MYRPPACQGGDAVFESGQAQNAAGRRQAVNTAAADPQLGLSGQQGPELLQEDRNLPARIGHGKGERNDIGPMRLSRPADLQQRHLGAE